MGEELFETPEVTEDALSAGEELTDEEKEEAVENAGPLEEVVEEETPEN